MALPISLTPMISISTAMITALFLASLPPGHPTRQNVDVHPTRRGYRLGTRVGEQQDDRRKPEQHTQSGEDERRPVRQLGVLTACQCSVYGPLANVAIADKRDAHDAEGDADHLIRPIRPS